MKGTKLLRTRAGPASTVFVFPRHTDGATGRRGTWGSGSRERDGVGSAGEERSHVDINIMRAISYQDCEKQIIIGMYVRRKR